MVVQPAQDAPPPAATQTPASGKGGDQLKAALGEVEVVTAAGILQSLCNLRATASNSPLPVGTERSSAEFRSRDP